MVRSACKRIRVMQQIGRAERSQPKPTAGRRKPRPRSGNEDEGHEPRESPDGTNPPRASRQQVFGLVLRLAGRAADRGRTARRSGAERLTEPRGQEVEVFEAHHAVVVEVALAERAVGLPE